MNSNNYFNNVLSIEKNYVHKSEKYWLKLGEKRVIQLFQQMSKRVPAYKDFLLKNKINPDKIRTSIDLKMVPPIDKKNYLRFYPLEMLCWDGEFKEKQWVISSTSGSTGEPFYFPRSKTQDDMYSVTAELYLRNNFDIQNKSTLFIDGFAMGSWIGGVFTYQAIKDIIERGKYNMSLITPGIFKEEIINAVRRLGEKFDQIIIGGYPPLIKDMIDDAISQNLNWQKYNLGFIFSAEGFSEMFRDYIIQKCGLKSAHTSTLNHYGSVDLGTMAHETPISIFIRRFLLKFPNLYRILFENQFKTPTFAQYNPEMFYFEEENEQLYCSSFSGLPLVRYDLKDKGGIYTFEEIRKRFKQAGKDLLKEAKAIDLGKNIWNLPFVYIYERSDFIVKLYGANIYPETIRKALQKLQFQELITGKFTMQIKFDQKHDQYLEINVELKKNIPANLQLEKDVTHNIVKSLLKENSEYRSNYKEVPDRQLPKIIFWEYEDPTYFRQGVKQKWVNK